MARHLLITGATGKTGTHATATLLARGHRVRVFVHRVDERSERLAEVGAEIFVGDLLDLGAVTAAAEGIDGAYLTYPIAPGLIEASAVLLQAAEENRLDTIVNMSQIPARRDAGSRASRQHWVAERLLDHFSGTVTHLRPTFFSEWLRDFRDQSTGDLRFPFASGRHAPISSEDQGRVIAAILEDPAPHAGKIYPLYGPIELDHHEIAEVVTKTLGYSVNYVPVEIEEFAAWLARAGRDPHLIQHLSNVAVDYRNGIFAGTNDLIKTITGTEPMTVETFVERNREDFDSHPSRAGR